MPEDPKRERSAGTQPTGHYGPGYGEADAPKGSAIEPLAQVEAPQPSERNAGSSDDRDRGSDDASAEEATTPPSPS